MPLFARQTPFTSAGASPNVGPNTGSWVPISAATAQPVAPFLRVNGEVWACAPDGVGGWYIGGKFTRVGGIARNRIARILPNGLVDRHWDPDADGGAQTGVLALAVSGSTVYVGGEFGSIGGQPRNKIAALDAVTGQATAWDPNANATVEALAVSGSTVYAAGWFTGIGGQPRNNLAALDAVTGAATAWNPNPSVGDYHTRRKTSAFSGAAQ